MELSCLNSRKYVLNFLSLGIRADGRVPDSARPISLNVGSISSADGSALVRCGNTLVICGVKMEVACLPSSKKGLLVCNVECGSGCLPESTSGAPLSHVQGLTKQLQLLLNKYLKLEELIVDRSELVWVVNVDVVCLSHHGNLLDSCSLAAVAALKNTHIPSLCVDLGHPKMKIRSTRIRLPLLIPNFTVSFAVMNNEWSLLDPSLEEERAALGHVSVSLQCDGSIIQLHHTGHKISDQEILRLSQLAMKQVTTFNELLQISQLTKV